MRPYIFLILIMFLVLQLTGCGKKKETLEEAQEPLSIEVSPISTTPVQQIPVGTTVVTPAPEKTTEIPLPPQGPYRPTSQQIQTALKSAGYYTGQIDGKVGPLTKKAIKEFQADNNLEVDGKVGPKTWAVLSRYLNLQPEAPTKR